MPLIAVRPAGSNILKVIEVATNQEGQQRLLEYVAADPRVQVFRIQAQGTGDFLFRRLRVAAGSEQYEQKLVGATFEDDV